MVGMWYMPGSSNALADDIKPALSSYDKGLADRVAWEAWFGAQMDGSKRGASFWAAQRSLPHPASCNTLSPASDEVAACETARSMLSGMDAQRRSDPAYKAGFNSFVAPSATTPLAGAQEAQVAPAHTRAEMPYGNHIGESAYVVSKTGVGSSHAAVTILLDWDQQVRACKEEFGDPKLQEQTQYQNCLDYGRKNFKGTHTMVAVANCSTGELQPFGGDQPSKFLIGEVPLEADKPDGPTDPVFVYNGFRIGNYGYTNNSTDAVVFRALCPASFRHAPASIPLELSLQADCQKLLPDAERIATEAGMQHLMNVQIISAYDVRNTGDYWYEAGCRATVDFNVGGSAALIYKLVPRHGEYFLSTQITR